MKNVWTLRKLYLLYYGSKNIWDIICSKLYFNKQMLITLKSDDRFFVLFCFFLFRQISVQALKFISANFMAIVHDHTTRTVLFKLTLKMLCLCICVSCHAYSGRGQPGCLIWKANVIQSSIERIWTIGNIRQTKYALHEVEFYAAYKSR